MGSFPHFDQFGFENQKGEEENKGKKMRGRKGEKRKRRFSQCSDGQISTIRELKLIHTMRATRGYQNLGVSSKSKRYGIFLLGLFVA